VVKGDDGLKPVLSHSWHVGPEEASRIQEALAKKVVVLNGFEEISSVAGADVAFDREKAYAAVVVCSYPELVKLEEVVVDEKVGSPYVPGLLSFREGPVLLKAFEEAAGEPDLILFDGQGIAHHRRLGLASHLGVLLGKPTIGCAKSRLLGEYRDLGPAKRCAVPLVWNGEGVGWAVRTRERVRPLFVSPGHLVDFETSVSIVLSCTRRFRIPEPLRQADLLSRRRRSSKRAVEGWSWRARRGSNGDDW